MARGLPSGGQGSKVYVLCAAPKEHKHFRPGTWPGGSGTRPGGSVTRVTEKLFMCQMFMCLFRPLLRRDLKVILVSVSRESQKSVSHEKQPKTVFCPVQQAVLGLSPQRPEDTFRTLLRHFGTFWLV